MHSHRIRRLVSFIRVQIHTAIVVLGAVPGHVGRLAQINLSMFEMADGIGPIAFG